MNLTGTWTALVLLLAIGGGHVWVVKLEYYVGARIWRLVLAFGLVLALLSLLAPNFPMAVILGVLAGSIIWGAGELPEQEERVQRGLFPANPKRVGGEGQR
jgi:hypothetical protein